jgi:hypothetical protein
LLIRKTREEGGKTMHRSRIRAGRLVEDIWNENKFLVEFISIKLFLSNL